jgi:hypothetical protein
MFHVTFSLQPKFAWGKKLRDIIPRIKQMESAGSFRRAIQRRRIVDFAPLSKDSWLQEISMIWSRQKAARE